MKNASATRKDIYPIGKKNPNLPFHPAVRAGDFIFISGQVAKDADGNMISGTIEEETRGTIEAIRRTVQGCRAGTHHGRGTGGDQHQDRNGRHCVQAAQWMMCYAKPRTEALRRTT